MELLHTYFDDSKLYKISASMLCRIPIWKGNRIIDYNHVNNIKSAINSNIQLLDSGYKTIQYDELDDNNKSIKKTYLIDGQHRISVVSDYFDTNENAKDFKVTVTEIKVDSELEAIDYFNKINNVKPIQYEEDPNLLINKYIQKLILSFSDNKKLFRTNATKRPYLSIEKFREAFKKRFDKLKNIPIDNFIKQTKIKNEDILRELEIRSLNETDREIKIINKILKINFGLAWDDKFKWLDEIN
jgi:hypothetical protein